MPSGYRLFIAALALTAALWTAFGMGIYVSGLSYPERELYESYRYAPENEAEAVAALDDQFKATEYRRPCENPKGSTESDLCAQWKAAKAAERAASWTKIGAIVSILSTVGLAITIILTLRAVQEAARAARAAEKSVEMGTQTSFQQLRAHLNPSKIRASWDKHVKNILSVRVSLFNSGQTPATNVSIYMKFYIDDYHFNVIREVKEASIFYNAIGAQRRSTVRRGLVFSDEEKVRFLAYEIHARCEIRLEYTLYDGSQDGATRAFIANAVEVSRGKMSVFNGAEIEREKTKQAEEDVASQRPLEIQPSSKKERVANQPKLPEQGEA